MSYQLRKIFDDLYRARGVGQDNLGSKSVEYTDAILWARLHSHELIEELSKHYIKHHTSITSIFVYFLTTANIYEPFQ